MAAPSEERSPVLQISEIRPDQRKQQFILIRRQGANFSFEGAKEAFLGHRIPSQVSPVADGIFADWKWDGEQLVARNDRYGVYPLFFCATPDSICLSPSLSIVASRMGCSKLDTDALAVFFRLGFFLAEDTVFKEVHCLPPGGTLLWNGSLNVSGDIVIPKLQAPGDEAALEEYEDRFSTAIRRRSPQGTIALPLSGGRDSRHILLELVRQGNAPIFCATMRYPPPYSSEDEIARSVCAAVGVEHRVFEATYSHPKWEQQKNVATDFSTFEHRWILELASNLSGQQLYLYDGAAGDVLSAGHFLDDQRFELYQAGKLQELADHLLGSDVIEKLVSPDMARALGRDVARDRLLRELVRHVDAPNQVGSFFFWNRTRRVATLGGYAILEAVGTVFAPFLDHDLWDFLASLPATMFLDHSFHTRSIEKSYPAHRRLPYVSKTKVPVSNSVVRNQVVSMFATLRRQQGDVFRSSAYLPRLVRGFVTPRYYLDMGLENVMIYLAQLNRLAEGRIGDAY